jgi:hypothetical protein
MLTRGCTFSAFIVNVCNKNSYLCQVVLYLNLNIFPGNFFFFLMPFPFFAILLLGYLFGRRFFLFQFHFAYPLLPSGGATGLRGTFPGHPRPFHLTFTDIHNTYTPMGAFSRRDSNPC